MNNTSVIKIDAPISKRYWSRGDIATLDIKNKKIRCGGCWFDFNESQWIVQPNIYEVKTDELNYTI